MFVDEEAARREEIEEIRETLVRYHHPRLHMSLIVTLTGAVGFLASFTLLHVGIDTMAIRYPTAVGIAYVAFLGLLWAWLRLRGSDLFHLPDSLDFGGGSGGGEIPKPVPLHPGGGISGGAGASGSWSAEVPAPAPVLPSSPSPSPSGGGGIDVSFDLDEILLVVVAIVAVAAGALAAIWIVWSAPGLFAEVLLDATLAGGLYRSLRKVRSEHWARTAIARTFKYFAGFALVVAAAGWCFQAIVPDARSIGDVFRGKPEVGVESPHRWPTSS